MEKTFKAIVAGTLSALQSLLGVLYIPVLIMVFSSFIDYATGLMAAPYREGKGCISSYRSVKGIKKKVCTWALVVVGAIIDLLIDYTTHAAGIELPFHLLVAGLVAVWVTCNEIISILENVQDAGVNIPPFLLPIVKNIKKQTEEKSNIKE